MAISHNEIHLWYAYDDSIKDSSLLSQYLNILNDEERVQQQRFHFEKHRHQYLITRATVRSVLSYYAPEISPAQWTFEKNEYGKPSITNKNVAVPLRFNISHTDQLIVMAVTLDRDLGVDVEYLPRLGKMLEIANSFFSPAEAQQLLALPAELQRNRFFDLWTLKEAYIKACGMGLSIPLDHFSYSFSDNGKISIDFKSERNDQPEYWQFWQMRPNDDYKVAMAIKSDATNVAYKVSMREIVPLSKITAVNYPISHGGIITD